MNEIEWLESGPAFWTARSNAYTIERKDVNNYIVREGHGAYVASTVSLPFAKRLANLHQNGQLQCS